MNPFCELIVARDSKGIIGNSAGNIPWHVPEDLAHFRKITTETPNSVLIMGRKTFDSLGAPLKNRIHIILTKNPALHRGNFRDVHFADYSNMPYIFDKFKAHRIFIIGGREIYNLFFDICRVVHLTIIHTDSGGDVSFSNDINETQFEMVNKSEMLVSKIDAIPYQFFSFVRKNTQ